MSVKEQINTDLKKALLDGDKERATILRGLKSTLLNAEIASGKRESGLDETEVIALMQKEVKTRKESAAVYQKGGAEDRANKELAEVAVIEAYLPEQMSDDELRVIVDDVMNGMGEVTPQMMGQIIGQVKQKAGSAADGGRIAAIVKERISA
jgi:uncharacterized protein YqeY